MISSGKRAYRFVCGTQNLSWLRNLQVLDRPLSRQLRSIVKPPNPSQEQMLETTKSNELSSLEEMKATAKSEILEARLKEKQKQEDLRKSWNLPSEQEKERIERIMKEIKLAIVPEHIFEIYGRDGQCWEYDHFAQALQKLAKLTIAMDIPTSWITESKPFKLICTGLGSSVQQIDPESAGTCLEALLLLNVKKDSVLVLSLLQMIRHNLWVLNLPQLSWFYDLLKTTRGSKLGDALIEAIPLKIQFEGSTFPKYDWSPRNIAMLFNTCVKEKLPLYKDVLDRMMKVTLSKLVHLEDYPDKLNDMFQFMSYFLDIEITELENLLTEEEKDIYNHISTTVLKLLETQPLEKMDCESVIQFLESLINQGIYMDGDFSRILIRLAEMTVKEPMPVATIFKAFEIHRKLNEKNEELTSHLLHKAIPEQLDMASLTTLTNIVIEGKQPSITGKLLSEIQDLDFSKKIVVNTEALTLPLSLMYIGQCQSQLLDIITNDNFLNEYLNLDHSCPHLARRVILLDQILALDETGSCRVSASVLEKARSIDAPIGHTEYLTALESILGPERFMLNVTMENGLFIDYMFVTKEGSVIPLHSEDGGITVDDSDEAIQQYAVLVVPCEHSMGPNKSSGLYKAYKNLLQEAGLHVIELREIDLTWRDAVNIIEEKLDDVNIVI